MARTNVFTTNGGDRNGVPNIAVVVTDGGANVNQNTVDDRARELRNNGRHLRMSYVNKISAHVSHMMNNND